MTNRNRNRLLSGRNWRAIIGVVAAALACGSSCRSGNQNGGGGDGGVDPDSVGGEGDAGVSRQAVAVAIGNCGFAIKRTFATQVGSLKAATETLAANGGEAEWTAAQQAWRQAALTWQQAELFRFGPTGAPPTPGARSLGDAISTWPAVNACFVDKQTVAEAYAAPTFGSSIIYGRGLYALEYLLFHRAADNACAGSEAINVGGAGSPWNALGSAEIDRRRRLYAKMAAADLSLSAEALVAAWAPEGGNFLGQLATAGSSDSVYSTPKAALDAITDALFYVEAVTKDVKLARPLGTDDDVPCSAAPCLNYIEAPYANASKEHLAANIKATGQVLFGCGEDGSGLAFEDLLIGVGAVELATNLKREYDAVNEALAAIEEPTFELALTNDLTSVQRLQTALKALVDRLRTQFLSLLNLQLPKKVETDND